MSKKQNIFIIGPMGAGKSTIGRMLADQLQYDFYDSDQEIEVRCGADISWIFDIEGEEGFRQREMKVIDELSQSSHIVLATGGGAIITPENRSALMSRGIVIYLKTSLEMQFQRTRHDAKRPLLHTDDVWARLVELWEHRSPLYDETSDYAFDTDSNSAKQITNDIISVLQKDSLL